MEFISYMLLFILSLRSFVCWWVAAAVIIGDFLFFWAPISDRETVLGGFNWHYLSVDFWDLGLDLLDLRT